MSDSGVAPVLDVVLLTHPRDEEDLPRLFPWGRNLERSERRELTACLKPLFAEIIRVGDLNAGILILPFYADQMMNPATRQMCRSLLEHEALPIVASAKARIVCLGGLTGALTNYGKKIAEATRKLGLDLTTGHSLTAVSVFRTYRRATEALGVDPRSRTMTVLGLGSIGAAFVELLVRSDVAPEALVLVDTPLRQDHVARFARALRGVTKIPITIESTLAEGTIPAESACYHCSFLITAVSMPYVIDVSRVASGTILIDDSQPFCWSRVDAWERCREQQDIVPCEAGLVDCSSIGYQSYFPFDFADEDDSGCSHTSWSCLAEGLLRALKPALPITLGEPDIQTLELYNQAFDELGFRVPPLQCGPNKLHIADLKRSKRGQEWTTVTAH